jgi:hypothetical protein
MPGGLAGCSRRRLAPADGRPYRLPPAAREQELQKKAEENFSSWDDCALT